MFQLSVCVEPLIGDTSFAERVKEVSQAGFLAKFWRWPGRHQPGTGEIHYPQIAQTLRDVGCSGTIGLECWPDGDLSQAMQAFKEVFG